MIADTFTQRVITVAMAAVLAISVLTIDAAFFAVVVFVGDGPRDRLLGYLQPFFTPAVIAGVIGFVADRFFSYKVQQQASQAQTQQTVAAVQAGVSTLPGPALVAPAATNGTQA